MANYISFGRSNYFKVKDEDAFRKWCADLDMEFISGSSGVGFIFGENGVPAAIYNEQTDEYDDYDFIGALASHLTKDGGVAIYQEIGYEKMRYLVGYSAMVEPNGKVTTVSISDIYDKAAKKKLKCSRCEY